MPINPADPRRKTYIQMTKLIRDNRFGQTPAMFSNYLMVAICWEESTFMNIPQEKGPAAGFGQMEPSAFGLINLEYDLKMNSEQQRAMILGSEAKSAEWVGRALHTLYSRRMREAKEKGKPTGDMFRFTLNAYAGNFGAYKAAWRDEAIQCWLNCERIQRNARHVIYANEYVPNRTALVDALWEGLPPNRRTRGGKNHPTWVELMSNVLAGIPD